MAKKFTQEFHGKTPDEWRKVYKSFTTRTKRRISEDFEIDLEEFVMYSLWRKENPAKSRSLTRWDSFIEDRKNNKAISQLKKEAKPVISAVVKSINKSK